jgi:hypothetical protein
VPETIAPGVAHRLAGRRGEARDVADDRLRHVLADVLGGLLLGRPADLAAHHDELGLGVVLEQRDDVDEARPRTGSPPMPTIVELPKPRWASSLPIW